MVKIRFSLRQALVRAGYDLDVRGGKQHVVKLMNRHRDSDFGPTLYRVLGGGRDSQFTYLNLDTISDMVTHLGIKLEHGLIYDDDGREQAAPPASEKRDNE